MVRGAVAGEDEGLVGQLGAQRSQSFGDPFAVVAKERDGLRIERDAAGPVGLGVLLVAARRGP